MISTIKNGYFAGNYTNIDDVPSNKTVVNVLYNGNYKPAWNGTDFEVIDEALELQNKTILDYTERIKTAFTSLRRRALGSSIGKSGSWEYLYEQSQQYKDKYNVAKGTYVNSVVSQMIADEANDFGITETEMNAMIIQMFEYGEIAYYQFTAMIERARTKALTLLDELELVRALQVIELMETVPEALTMQDAENLATTLISI